MRHPRRPVIAIALLLAALAGGAAFPGRAEGATTAELSDLCNAVRVMHSDKAYVPAGFRILLEQSDRFGVAPSRETLPATGCGFQAIAFEEVASGGVFVVYGGTEGMDLEDLLADFGILAREVDSLRNALAQLLKPKNRLNRGVQLMSDAEARAVVRAAASRRLDTPGETLKAQLKAAWDFYFRVQELLAGKSGFAYLTGSAGGRAEGRAFRYDPDRACPVTLVGHSLGGYLVQIVSAYTSQRAYTFNAPGAAAMAAVATDAPCVNYRRRHDLVAIYGRKLGPDVSYSDVPIHWSNFPKPFFIRNHLITQFHQDLVNGLEPMPASR